MIDIGKTGEKTIIIDIDGVLLNSKKPIDLAKESLLKLKKHGYKIILYTSRHTNEKEKTIKWLDAHGIIYDSIKFKKPRGILYIDDRAYRFTSWNQFFEDVKI